MRPATIGAIAAASFNTTGGGAPTQIEHISSTVFGPIVSLVQAYEYPSSTAFGPAPSEVAP